VYGIKEAGGFIQLTGEVGTGKTTIIRSLLAQIPRDAEVALILNPRLSPTEFMLTICEELGIGVPDESVHSAKDLVDILNAYLLRAHSRGQRVVLVQTAAFCEFFKAFLLCLVGLNVAHQCVDALVMDVVAETVPGSVQP
jgi:type II secretory pathway predicted ATPase ExeA